MTRIPTRFQQRTVWLAATALAIAVLGALLTATIWLAGKVFGFLQPVLVPLAVAGIIAYLLDPLVRWLQGRGLSRLRAVLTVFGAAVAAIAVLLAIMIPQVGNQIREFRRSYDQRTQETEARPGRPFDEAVVERLDQLRNNHRWLEIPIDHLLETHDDGTPRQADDPAPTRDDTTPPALRETRLWHYGVDYGSTLGREVFAWVRGGAGRFLSAFGLLIGFVMVPVYLFYFLKDLAAIESHWHDYVPLRASHFKDEVVATIREINGYLIAFFRGQVLVAVIDGLLVGIALTVFQLPLGLLIGLLVAVLGVIPYIGNILCLIPACAIGFVHFADPSHQHILGSSPWAYVAAVVVIFFAVQQINSLVTAPRIVGDSVGLHPMTVIFSMLFWSLVLGGFIGALLAVPLTAAVKVLFRRYIWQRKFADDAHPAPA